MVKGAPHTTPVRRLDEVRAAREPVLRWESADAPVTFGSASRPSPVGAG